MKTKPCRECGESISSKAAICPHCGVSRKNPRRRWVGCGILFLVVLFILGGVKAARERREAARLNLPLVVMGAPELFEEYHRNEVAADERYHGRRAELQGEIRSIGKNLVGQPFVLLKTKRLMGVQCLFPRKDAAILSNLKPGQEVRLLGTLRAKHGHLLLDDCRFP